MHQIESDDVELSVTQEQLWFATRMGVDGSVYTECTGLRLRGPLDVDALDEALRRVVARHEVLRTVVVAAQGRPVMRVGPVPAAAPLERADLCGAGHGELGRIATGFAEAPVDLAVGPLFRALLVRTGDDDHALVLAAHHLVCDAAGAAVVWSEIVADYVAITGGVPGSPVPEPDLQYADIAVWEREVLASHVGERDVDFWRERLAGVDPVLELPLGRPRPAAKGGLGVRREFPVADDAAAALLAVCARNRCSAHVALLACFAAVTHLLTGRTELVVGTLLANRRAPEVEGMVGQFSTTVPLVLDLAGDPTFEQLLRRYAGVLGSAVEHGQLGFGQIVRQIDPARDPSRNALVQHLFLTREQPVGGGTLGAASVEPFDVERTRGRFDTITEVEVTPERVRAWVEFDTALADEAAVADVLADLGAVLRTWTADPGLRLSALAGALGTPLPRPVLVSGPAAWTVRALDRALAGPPAGAATDESAPLSGAAFVLMEQARTAGPDVDPAVVAALDLRAGETVLLHPGFRRGAAVLAAAVAAGATVQLTDGASPPSVPDDRPVTVLAAAPEDLPWLAPGAWPSLRVVVVDAPQPAWLREWADELIGVRVTDTVAGTGEASSTGLPDTLPAALLMEHPAIAGVHERPGGLEVTPVPTTRVGSAELATYLAQRLPSPLRPARLTVTEPAAQDGVVPGAVLDGDPLLAVVCALWAEVLDLPAVAPDEDFFALGGHSMLCSRMTAQTAELLQAEVPLRSLFENPTAAGFTAELRRMHPGVDRLVELVHEVEETLGGAVDAAPPPVPAVGASAVERLLPLSAAQLQLWLMEQLRPGTLTHTVPMRVSVRGPLDRAHLAAALNDVVARQEALRSTFVEVGGEPLQRIAPSSHVDLRLVDLSGMRAAERAAELLRLREVTAHTAVDIGRGPLLVARLIRSGEHEHALDLVFHHLITDEVSMTVFMTELSAYYRARVTGTSVDLPPLTVDLATAVSTERALLDGAEGDALRRYWIRQLAGAPELVLPTDRPRPDQLTLDGEFLHRRADAALARGMVDLARAERATAYTVFLTAVLTVLRRRSGQDDIVVGVPSDNRWQAGSEHLQGCFLNVLPLRVDCGGDPSFRALLRRVRDRLLDVYDHQRLPISEIVHAVRPDRVGNRLPLFQVTCELQLGGWMPLRLTGAECDYELLSHGTARYDLAFHGQARADHLSVAVEMNTALWDVATGHERIADVVAVLGEALEDPGRVISRLAA
jgi:non-ribosomal peptide synthetase component F